MNPIEEEGRHVGHGHHHRPGLHGHAPVEGMPRGPRRRGRVPRGDVRAAVLLLLAEQPMHGYQLMQAIADRTGGRWTPSPGAIYPTISQLEDESLVTVTADSGRKLVSLTEAGREHVDAAGGAWTDPFAGYDATSPDADLRGLLQQLHGAARQVARAGTDAQRAAAAKILEEARRSLYLLLAESPRTPDA